MAQYNPKSLKAGEFINHEEILETLRYAEENKNNVELIDSLLEKARPKKNGNGVHCEGLTHREASVLLACEIPEKVEEMYRLAEEIKLAFYGNRIVMFAPLYLSNYCVNGCVYCPYHSKNKHICRKKLTQDEIRNEVIALQDMGHKRLAIEAGEDPVNNPIEYILESIKTIYSIQHKNGAIRRVNVNIAATTVEEYRMLKEAGIGTYILFQETYHRDSYLELHPTGPKHNYEYHTEAMDRAMEAASTTWDSACSLDWSATNMNSRACSCTRSIWKLFTAWGHTRSACRVSSVPTTSTQTRLTTGSTTKPSSRSSPASALPCRIPA